MIQGSQWPSFIIQGILLGTDLYLMNPCQIMNTWILLSILTILFLFSLQATSERFIYLFPIIKDTNIKTTDWDTQILRIGISVSSLFLYLGLRENQPLLNRWWSLPSIAFLLLFIPLVFNFYLNKKFDERARSKHEQVPMVDLGERGKIVLSPQGIVWQPKVKQYQVSWNDLLEIMESKKEQ